MGATRVDATTGLGETEVVKTITEARTGVTYVGRSHIQTASTSDAKWQIYRVVTISNLETKEYAGGGYYNQVWDNRTTLFGPDAAFTNAVSTNFDGVNDYLSAGNNFNKDNATAWSISMWVKPNNVAAQRCLYSKTSNDANVFGIGIYHTVGGNILVQMRAASQLRSYTTTLPGVVAGVWTHLVVTYSGGQDINGIRVYSNAVVDSTPSSGAITNTLLTLENAHFATRNSGFYFSGNLDEISFWDKALDQSEVTELYNGGIPNNAATASMAGSLEAFYRMGDVDTHPTIYDQAGTVDLTMFNMDATSFESDVP